MTQSNQYDIEHPAQSWWRDSYAEQVDPAHESAILERYKDVDYDVSAIIAALANVTSFNHLRRQDHESLNLQHLGLHLPSDRRYHTPNGELEVMNVRQQEYETLAGQPRAIGRFVQWFSYVSHTAFVAQEHLSPDNEKFERVSLELGGKRQFGDWENTGAVDTMIRAIPEQLLEAEPTTRLTVYGVKEPKVSSPAVTHVPQASKSYILVPRPDQQKGTYKETETDGLQKFSMAMVIRSRPVADIFIEGQSDIVISKKSTGLLVMDLLNPGLKDRIYADCLPRLYANRNSKEVIKFEDTPGALMAGAVFERTIREPVGESIDLLPVSAHYIQGVGEKFAQFRKGTTN